MKELRLLKLGLIIAVFGLLGCSTNSTDETERTFPEAFNFESTTIDNLRNEVAPPDSLNITAFVVGIRICPLEPEDGTCFFPDGITISESPNWGENDAVLGFTLAQPQQFQRGQQYLFSVGVRTNNGRRTFFDLLGYSSLQPAN